MRRDPFQAIADPTRRAIIALIASQSLHLNAIAENFQMSRPAVSQHMKILVDSGLVTVNKQGRERYCELRLDKLNEIAQWVEPYRLLWQERYERLDQLLNKS